MHEAEGSGLGIDPCIAKVVTCKESALLGRKSNAGDLALREYCGHELADWLYSLMRTMNALKGGLGLCMYSGQRLEARILRADSERLRHHHGSVSNLLGSVRLRP